MQKEDLKYDDYVKNPTAENRVEDDTSYRCPVSVLDKCHYYFYERHSFIWDIIIQELDIIDDYGELSGVPLGDKNRRKEYVDFSQSSIEEIDDWRKQRFEKFFEELFAKGIFDRMHEDFQLPLIEYIEYFLKDIKEEYQVELDLEDLILEQAIRNGESIADLPFSDEMKLCWEPLKRRLVH